MIYSKRNIAISVALTFVIVLIIYWVFFRGNDSASSTSSSTSSSNGTAVTSSDIYRSSLEVSRNVKTDGENTLTFNGKPYKPGSSTYSPSQSLGSSNESSGGQSPGSSNESSDGQAPGSSSYSSSSGGQSPSQSRGSSSSSGQSPGASHGSPSSGGQPSDSVLESQCAAVPTDGTPYVPCGFKGKEYRYGGYGDTIPSSDNPFTTYIRGKGISLAPGARVSLTSEQHGQGNNTLSNDYGNMFRYRGELEDCATLCRDNTLCSGFAYQDSKWQQQNDSVDNSDMNRACVLFNENYPHAAFDDWVNMESARDALGHTYDGAGGKYGRGWDLPQLNTPCDPANGMYGTKYYYNNENDKSHGVSHGNESILCYYEKI